MKITKTRDQFERQKFRSPGSVRSAVVCLWLAVALAAPAVQASMPGNQVGKVMLVLGKAWITKPGIGRKQVEVGTEVGVYDKIDTASDGHVHIMFIDDALVSVRPYSSLEIQRYDYDAANPEASAIKLNLLEGETRAISGQAAQKARQNFRMNTPVAAIGVRGTDFVASVEGGEVEARINEGTIIVAPFSNECLADALGPCSANSLELAFMHGANQIVQVGSAGNAVLLPISASGLPESMIGQSLVEPPATAPNVARAGNDEARDGGELYAESVAALAVNPRLVDSRPTTPAPPIDNKPPVTEIPQVPEVPQVPQVPEVPPVPPVAPIPQYTPAIAISAETLKNSQLIWGRWYEPAQAYERITVDYATAVEGRKPAMGNAQYAMFREATLPRVQHDLGVVDFSLGSAQSIYRTNGLVELLDVNGGTLNIDFNRNTFATSLTMRGATLGAVDFSASGRVLDGGFFNMSNPSQEMAGVISFDGKEAGYHFEKALEGGSIEGLTLWGRQP